MSEWSKTTAAQRKRLGVLAKAAEKAQDAFYRAAQNYREGVGSCIGVTHEDKEAFDSLLQAAETASTKLRGAWFVLGAMEDHEKYAATMRSKKKSR
ncbi:MAG TPA: hypothetical protein VFN26_11645 [Candidatus Acidoferrum sp.]|nr:hypothetical protein [Candidatus Acidoferrum sp.]